MSQYVHLYPRYLLVEIEKPLFEYNGVSTVRISKNIVDRAVHSFVQLVVITPKGEKVFYPKRVKKDGKKVKEVFLYPDNPMIMYEIEVPFSELSDIDRWRFS